MNINSSNLVTSPIISGRCVCDDCSREKVRIPKFDDRTLFKVCTDCAKVFKAQRTYGV